MASKTQARALFSAPGLKLLLLSSLLSAACLVPDLGPPDSPIPDFERITVSATKVDLGGFAEPGALVEISRDPPIESDDDEGDDGLSTLAGSDGRFALELPLARNKVNVFELVAVDFEGRRSRPARVSVSQERLRVRQLVLELDSESFVSDEEGKAQVAVRAQIEANDPKADLSRFEVEFLVRIGAQILESTRVRTSASGQGAAELSFEGRAGAVRLEARLVVQGASDEEVLDWKNLQIKPGSAYQAILELAGADGSFSADPRIESAGTTLRAQLRISDKAGNSLSAPWELEVVPAGSAELSGDRLKLIKAGEISVQAKVLGEQGSLPSSAPKAIAISVIAAGGGENEEHPSVLKITLPELVNAGQDFNFEALLLDPWKNPLEIKQLRVSSDSASASIRERSRSVTLTEAGQATLLFEAERRDGRWFSATHRVKVLPGPAHSLEFRVDGQLSTPQMPVKIPAGAAAKADFKLQDAFGNSLPIQGISITPAGGWEVEGHWLFAPNLAGSVEMNAQAIEDGEPLATASAWLEVVPDLPTHLSLDCPPLVVAGEAFSCVPQLEDTHGNPIGTELNWELFPAEGSEIEDGQLLARKAGMLEVKASVEDGAEGEEGALLEQSVFVEVLPADPVRVSLELEPSSAVAGETVQVLAFTWDAFDNPSADSLELSSDAPGAYFVNGKLLGLTQAGTFAVEAHVPQGGGQGTGGTQGWKVPHALGGSLELEDLEARKALGQSQEQEELEELGVPKAPLDTALRASKTLEVEPAEPARIVFSLSEPEVELGQSVGISLGYEDSFGNLCPEQPVLSANDQELSALGIERVDDTLSFSQTGTFLFKAAAEEGEEDAEIEPVTRMLVVYPAVESTPPKVQAFVVAEDGNLGGEQGAGAPETLPIFAPSEELRLAIAAEDKFRLSEIEVSAQGNPLLNPVQHTWAPPKPVKEWMEELPLELKEGGLGRVEWTVRVRNVSGLETLIEGAFEVSLLRNRWTFSPFIQGEERVMSLSPDLVRPQWIVAHPGAESESESGGESESEGEATIFVAQREGDTEAGGVHQLSAEGELSLAWDLDLPRGLAVEKLEEGWCLYSGTFSSEPESLGAPVIWARDSGESPRVFAGPFPSLEQEPSEIADLSLGAEPLLRVAETQAGEGVAGRIWLLPTSETSVDLLDPGVSFVTLPDHRPVFLCAGGADDVLYFSALREDEGQVLWTGIYSLEIEDGELRSGVQTLFEEFSQVGLGSTQQSARLAGCAVSGDKIFVLRNDTEFEGEPEEATQASVLQISLPCQSQCNSTVVAESARPEQKPLAGLAALKEGEGSLLVIAEPESGSVFSLRLTEE